MDRGPGVPSGDELENDEKLLDLSSLEKSVESNMENNRKYELTRLTRGREGRKTG